MDDAANRRSDGAVRAPDATVGAPDLAAIEATVRRAVDERRPELLTLVGHGEFSLAMRWSSGDEVWVVKRVPPFATRIDADAYVGEVRGYVAALEARGVSCVTTRLGVLDRDDGTCVVFHSQPLLDASQLASNVLRPLAPHADHPIVAALVQSVGRVVDARTGLDAQCSNWYWDGTQLWYLDFSTPLLLTDDARPRFAIDGFLAEYPACLRGVVRAEFFKLIPRYTTAEGVLLDVLAMLRRDDLAPWTDAFVVAAKRHLRIECSAATAARMYASDARFFPWMLRLKRARRWWVQRRGGAYPTLLPSVTSFGR